MNRFKNISFIATIFLAVIYGALYVYPIKTFYKFEKLQHIKIKQKSTNLVEVAKKNILLPGPNTLWAIYRNNKWDIHINFGDFKTKDPVFSIAKYEKQRDSEEDVFNRPIFTAIKKNRHDEIRRLISDDYNVNEFDESNILTPLLYSIYDTTVEINTIELLLNNGADVGQTNAKGFTALTFVANGPDLDNVSSYGGHIWTGQFSPRSLEITKLLIKYGADINQLTNGQDNIITSSSNDSALLLSANQTPSHLPIYLIDHGADIKIQREDGKSLLFFTVDPILMKCLLEKGLDPNKKDEEGNTPLHFARNAESVELLISYGANLEAANEYGVTPLASNRHTDSIVELIKNGANVFLDKNIMEKFLKHTAMFTRVDVVRLLLSKGVDLNQQNRQGKTFLHHIATVSNINEDQAIKVVSLLLEHKVNFNTLDSFGFTPLDYIYRNKKSKSQLGSFLIENGAKRSSNEEGNSKI